MPTQVPPLPPEAIRFSPPSHKSAVLPSLTNLFLTFIHFCCQNTYTLFVFLQVFLDVTVTVTYSFFVYFLFAVFHFTVSEAFARYILAFRSLFALVDDLFMIFLPNFVTLFFFTICRLRLPYLCVLVLLFRLASPLLFLLFRCLNTLIISITPLTSLLFLPLILPAHHHHLCQYDVFFDLVHASKNMI